MKFLIFNLAVAAALVFLFTADRSEVQRVAGQVHTVVGEVKDYARKALNDGQAALGRGPVAAAAASDARPSGAAKVSAQPSATPAPPRDDRAKEPERDGAPPKPAARPGTAIAQAPRAAVPVVPATVDPAVAQRRREVLAGVAPAGPAPALKEGSRLMSPTERRKELLSLAEEMELLYARSISR